MNMYSEPMYKAKIAEWKWYKNIPAKFIPEVSRLVKEREPKDSVVKFGDGPKRWTPGDIQRRSDKVKKSSNLTRQGVCATIL